MRRAVFEQRILELWVGTRVPLNRVNLQVLTGVPRKKLERWLDEMVGSEMLEVDSDDVGELEWSVVGAERSRTGTTSVSDLKKLDGLRSSLPSSSTALARVAGTALARRGSVALGRGGAEEKSVVASAALGFFLGPLGWLYAAPLKDALPAIGLVMLVTMILPHFLLLPLLGIAAPLSALAAAFYAWQHNSAGHRVSLSDIGKDR
ncbi:MAG: hypothetical protein ABI321_05295 [Polyangia bacterium]